MLANNIILEASSFAEKLNLRSIEVGAPIAIGRRSKILMGRDAKGKPITLKIPHNADDPQQIARLKREYVASRTIGHPAIINHYALGATEFGQAFIVSDFINAKTLENYRRYKGGTLTVTDVILFAYDLTISLGAAHLDGFTHGNVIPENVLVCSDDSVKLTSLGSARWVSKSGTLEGFNDSRDDDERNEYVAWSAPEVLQDEQPSHKTDIWQLGLLMNYALTGTMPHTTRSHLEFVNRRCSEQIKPSKTIARVAPNLAAVVAKALRLNPSERYGTIQDMRAAIRAAFVDIPI